MISNILISIYLIGMILSPFIGGYIAARDWIKEFGETDLRAALLGVFLGLVASIIWPLVILVLAIAYTINKLLKFEEKQ